VRGRAHAKINLSLEVLGSRSDGYHNLISVMQTVTLADDVDVRPAPALVLRSDRSDLETDDNLILRAARLLRSGDPNPGAEIQLTKKIPVAAGLGGGSSDGAAALVLLNRLWDLGLDCRALTVLAERLGADVPFFLYGGTCLVEGKGERVTPLPRQSECWYVLACPNIAVSTARIFRALPAEDWSDGQTTRLLAGTMATGACGIGKNTLQRTLFRLHPEADACFRALERVAPAPAMVSGSGPTSFVQLDSRAEATRMAERLGEQGYWARVVTSCKPKEEMTPCA
jgi:4-diphosphocytidyl-2-C-methyl-D-erythritol kinase